jgi:hypothetical protein
MRVKEAYMFAEELMSQVEDGSIDMDQAANLMADEYPALEYNHIMEFFHDVLEFAPNFQ